MYCKNCGSEIKENQKYCPKCGNRIENLDSENIIDNKFFKNESESTVKNRNNKRIFVIISFALFLIIVILLIVSYANNSKNKWEDYLNTHQIDSNATDFTYYITKQGGDASDFSYDLETERIISSQEYDIDNDGQNELLQISIIKDKDSIQIYPSLQITEEYDGSYKTERYNFNDANYYISSLFEGNYYLYKSDKNTYVLIEKDAPGESWQYCAACVIDDKNMNSNSYYFINYDDGSSEVYDIAEDEVILAKGDYGSAFYTSQMSNLRILFSSLGLKGFLTGIDDVDNIMNYDDITLIGKFSVEINGNNGHITYTDLISQK